MDFSELQLTASRNGRSRSTTNGRPRRGVLLMNLGTPDEPTPASVRNYLREFLVDPAVIQLPKGLGFLNGPLGKTIAMFRAKHSAGLYRSIWTDEGSPLLTITQEQVKALQGIMPSGWRVYSAMRYGNPSIPSVLQQIERDGLDELVIVPMYPQYSGPTTGTAMRVVYDYLGGDDHPLQLTTRLSWYNDHGYIAAQTELLRQYASEHDLTPDNCFLLFSTHGLPVSYVEKGDPYPSHVAETVALVSKRLGWAKSRWSLAFQSRFGPAKWLQPYTDESLESLSQTGEKKVLVCPISFVTDCLETLEEIEKRYRKLVEPSGTEMHVCPALNTFAPFIGALKHLVLQGCSAMSSECHRLGDVAHATTTNKEAPGKTDSLIVVGASVAGKVGSGTGPALKHVDAKTLRQLKRPAYEIPAFLREVRDACGLQEAFIWNTCHRFEVYGFPKDDGRNPQEVADAIASKIIEGTACEGPVLNKLFGADAMHHMLRTANGLNSGLPGERDILDQLCAAQRLAERSETGGPLVRSLINSAINFEKTLRSDSTWGDFAPDYAQIALQFVADKAKVDFGRSRILVIGGSTTSAAVLRTLSGHLGVSSKQLTLIYRGHKHGGHLKLLRKAIGQGERIRVQNYEEKIVDRALAEADVVIFGVDGDTPLLDAERVQRCREAIANPLIVIDFNMYGSTRDLSTQDAVKVFALSDIDRAVNASAGDICADNEFQQALAGVEARIASTVREATTTSKHKEAVVPFETIPATALAGSTERSVQ